MTERMEQLSQAIEGMVNGISSITTQAQDLVTTQEQTTASANDVKLRPTKHMLFLISSVISRTKQIY